MMNKHSEEDEVKRFIDLPKRNKQRKQILKRLRQKGNSAHNTKSIAEGGTIKVVRKSKRKGSYIHCTACKKILVQRFFSNHQCENQMKPSSDTNESISSKTPLTTKAHSLLAPSLNDEVGRFL